MENFLVSARKYRPTTFGHVVGQPHVTTTLKHAIKDKQLAHAFLFCGPEGIGKTTCARILAKAINCEQITKNIEPCNVCASCKSFNQGGSLNIYEIDAASNNSVEAIRSLVEQVRYPPQASQYKVYIIDEVHMLSSAAFNAFLKTLEEPPSYAIFILATTEKHKVLPTILSRCQIFDFRRIQTRDIVQQLQNIAQEKGITYEEEALYLIGQKADGILRTSLSIFDKISNYGASQLTYQATLEHLQLSDYAHYFQLTEALLQGDRSTALELYDKILKAGHDRRHFIGGLGDHLRNLLICQDQATHQLLEVAVSTQQRYQAQAAQASPTFLLAALRLVNQCDIHYQSSHNKQLHVELLLIELAQLLHPHDREVALLTTQPATPSPQSKPLLQVRSGSNQHGEVDKVSADSVPKPAGALQTEPVVQATTEAVAAPTTTASSSGHDQAATTDGEKPQQVAATPAATRMDGAQLQHTIKTTGGAPPTTTASNSGHDQAATTDGAKPQQVAAKPAATRMDGAQLQHTIKTTGGAPPTTTTPSPGHAQPSIADGAKPQQVAAKPAATKMDGAQLQHTIKTTGGAPPTTTTPSPGHAQPSIADGAKPQQVAAKPAATKMDGAQLQHTIKLPQLAQLKARIAQEDSLDDAATPAEATAPVSLTLEALQEHWQAYAAQLKEAGRLPAYRLLLQEITLAGTKITVRFTNAAQEGILSSIKEELLTYLRAKLQHDSLDVEGLLVSTTGPKVPYTAQEKFEYLAEKHPHLRAFQQQLGLEVVA